MITIQQYGEKVKVEIDPEMRDRKVMCLYWNCGSEWYAQLLVEKINAEFHGLIERIRKAEYDAGWKDAKSHKQTKRTWFRCTLFDGR